MMQPDFRLILTRHGHAEANRPWAFLGRTDSPLSAQGREQAAALSALLADFQLDAIYASPLQRARQTAVTIAVPHALTPILDDRLVEQDFGLWEGLTLDDVEAQFPDDAAAWQADARQHGPTGGENLTQVAARARRFYRDMRQARRTGVALVVAHGGILNALLCTLLGTPLSWLWAYRLDVGAVCELHLYGSRATLVRLNGR